MATSDIENAQAAHVVQKIISQIYKIRTNFYANFKSNWQKATPLSKFICTQISVKNWELSELYLQYHPKLQLMAQVRF